MCIFLKSNILIQGQLQQLQQANEGSPTLAVGGYTLDEYNVMLRNELQLRQWHSGNLRQTIERNRANYKSVEQGLLSMNLSHKKWYESALEQLYPKETTEHGDVHKEIRKMLESAPKSMCLHSLSLSLSFSLMSNFRKIRFEYIENGICFSVIDCVPLYCHRGQ